jgi:hypothetical protein
MKGQGQQILHKIAGTMKNHGTRESTWGTKNRQPHIISGRRLRETFPMASGMNRGFGRGLEHVGRPLRSLDRHRDKMLLFGTLIHCKPVKANQSCGDNRHCSRLDAIHKRGDHRTIPLAPKPIGGIIERYCDKRFTGNKPLFDLTKSGPQARFPMKLKGSPSRPQGRVETKELVSHPSAPFTAFSLNRGEICLAQILLEEVR